MRVVKFYETVFGIKLVFGDCCETEKMAFFLDGSGNCYASISYASDYVSGLSPSKNGVLVCLFVEDIDVTLALIMSNGSEIVRSQTKINADNCGYFAIFTDSEGNNIGLYSDK